MSYKKLIPIIVAFLIIISAVIVGIHFLKNRVPKAPADTTVTNVMTTEKSEDIGKKGSNDAWEYIEYENSITLTKRLGLSTKGVLEELVIPDEINDKPVTDMAEDIFKYFHDEEIEIGKWTFSKYFVKENNVVFNESKTSLFCTTENFDSSDYTVPVGVEKIYALAFMNNINIKSVTLPNTVTTIGDCVFQNCDSLTNVTIPDSVTFIGNHAFHGCFSLTSITIPNKVTSIGEYAFEYCNSLKSLVIPDSVTSIGYGAFNNCSGLTSLTIGNNVASIGQSVFSNCTGLTSITIPGSVTSIGDGAFWNCTALTSITISNSVKSIGKGAFSYCSSLKSITIPNSVASIGEYAFGYNDSMDKVNDFTIYGASGSAAEKYAKDNGFTFVAQ